jgi:hypothetical protein
MYKNVKIFKKQENLQKKISFANISEKLEHNKTIPLGVDEVFKYCSIAPIIIAGGDESNQEFLLFSGIGPKFSVLLDENIEEPVFTKHYPFLMVMTQADEERMVPVIGIDDDENYVGEDKDIVLFDEKEKLNTELEVVLDEIRDNHKKRFFSKRLIQELQAHDLLVTQSFNLKIEGEIQTILKDYKIVDRDRLMSLDDEILAQWAKRGWIGIIDAHIYSLSNFEKLVQRIK